MTITARYPGKCSTCGQAVRTGDQIEWTQGMPARHTKCPAAQVAAAGGIRVSRGSGNGGSAYAVGQTLLVNGKWVVVTKTDQEYIREDGMSFGVGDDNGYLYRADCRPATDAEAADAQAARDARLAAKAAAKQLADDRRACIAKVMQGANHYVSYGSTTDAEWIEVGSRAAGSENWAITPTHIAYLESSYDDGPRAWAVIRTDELVAEIRNLWPTH